MENHTEEVKSQQEPQDSTPNKLTIEIRRFQNLLEILKDRKKVITLSFSIAAIGILLFSGITLIVLSIKRLYPYNDITTNAMGTTTLRSEDKDVSYFLLSSSELWANSGIQVKKGQTVTIKSSGKKHSAIHHLVDNAQNNAPALREPWIGAEGFPETFDTRQERDRHRAKYRIFPQTNQDILLMQIVSNGEPSNRPDFYEYNKRTKKYEHKESDNQFIVVGNKMDNIHINTDGVLYFAINDIVLDESTIAKMMLECGGAEIVDDDFSEILGNLRVFRENHEKDYDTLASKYDILASKYDTLAMSYKTEKELSRLSRENDSLLHETSLAISQNNSIIESINQGLISNDSVNLDSINAFQNSLYIRKRDLENYKSFIDYKIVINSSMALYNHFLDTLTISQTHLDKNKKNNLYGNFQFGNGYGIDKDKIELYGYFMKHYKEAWYEDNVGSFLIVVEIVNE